MNTTSTGQNFALLPVILPAIYFSIVGFESFTNWAGTIGTTIGTSAGGSAIGMYSILFLGLAIPALIILWGTLRLKYWVRRWGMIFAGAALLYYVFNIRTILVYRNAYAGDSGSIASSMVSLLISPIILAVFSAAILPYIYARYRPDKYH